MIRRVQLESPFRGETDEQTEEFLRYGLRAMAHSLSLGEAPFASHLLYTQVLDDKDPEQRRQGIEAGLAWGRAADATVVYSDYGVSSGMQQGIDRAVDQLRPVEFRRIGKVSPAP